MNLQTKIALKVEEMKRKAEEGDDALAEHIEQITNEPNERTNVVEMEHSEDDLDEKETDNNVDINPFYREPLYVGSLCLPSKGTRYYRWIVFVSTSEEEITPPKSVKSVTYTLHPTYSDSVRDRTKTPFFLDIEGWGVFELQLTIHFKNNFIRPFIETSHMISVDYATTTTCIESNEHRYYKHLFPYHHFKQFRNEPVSSDTDSVSFVKKAANRLKRNLLKTPSPLYFQGFNGTLSAFKTTLKQCLCDPQCTELKALDIPESILDVITIYSTFGIPLNCIMPNQEVYIEQCSDSKVTIDAAKFNHLRLRKCRNMTVQ